MKKIVWLAVMAAVSFAWAESVASFAASVRNGKRCAGNIAGAYPGRVLYGGGDLHRTPQGRYKSGLVWKTARPCGESSTHG